MKALSIRQPWAWLIVAGYKTIENRTWPTTERGPVLIHASKTMTFVDYKNCAMFVATKINPVQQRKIMLPAFNALPLGGVVGQADLIDCISASDNPWYMGGFGFVFANAQQLEFKPCQGALKFFQIP